MRLLLEEPADGPEDLLLHHGPEKFEFLRKSRLQIDGVDDLAEWRLLRVCCYLSGDDSD